jgi:hypothetical protein
MPLKLFLSASFGLLLYASVASAQTCGAPPPPPPQHLVVRQCTRFVCATARGPIVNGSLSASGVNTGM